LKKIRHVLALGNVDATLYAVEAVLCECRRNVRVGLRDVLGMVCVRVGDDQVKVIANILLGWISQDVGDRVRRLFASLDDADEGRCLV
jgi:hypothetical protein